MFFISVNYVDAGVCDNKEIKNGYCSGFNVTYEKIQYNGKTQYNGYHLFPIGFSAKETNGTSTSKGIGVCLDPALESPDGENYSYKRELNINSSMDLGIYKLYQ